MKQINIYADQLEVSGIKYPITLYFNGDIHINRIKYRNDCDYYNKLVCRNPLLNVHKDCMSFNGTGLGFDGTLISRRYPHYSKSLFMLDKQYIEKYIESKKIILNYDGTFYEPIIGEYLGIIIYNTKALDSIII